MKLLIISKIFPNCLEPMFGPFVLNETLEFARHHELRVIAPVPWFPRWSLFKKWYHYSQIPAFEMIQDLSVAHPRYFVSPRIGRMFYGVNYIWGIHATVTQLWQKFRFDAIIAHYAYPDGYAAAYFRKKFQRPLMLKVHGSDINEDTRYFSRRLGTFSALRQADRVIAVSHALKRRISALGLPTQHVKVLHNGVDLAQFRPMDPLQCRRELNLPQDTTLLLCIANLLPVKGLPTLIMAFQRLLAMHPEPVMLFIVGEGPARVELEALLARQHLENKIILCGAQPHSKIPIWLNAADVFCLSSVNEGYPTVLIEAQACGVPVVATDVGGVSEIIQSRGCERMVPAGDHVAFAQALNDLLTTIRSQPAPRQPRFQRTWADVVQDLQLELEELVYANRRSNKLI